MVADIVRAQSEGLPTTMQTRLVDMGDGTHAPVRVTYSCCEESDGVLTPANPRTDVDGILVVTSVADYRVELGERFKASYVQPHGGELADDASVDFLVRVGSCHVHATARVAVAGNCELLMYEGPTNTNVGAGMAAICKNRDTPGPTEVLTYSGPTITNAGTLLFHWFVPGGTKKDVGQSWGEAEWILAPDTDYLLRVTNRSGGAIQFSFSIAWSEHE